MKGNSVNFFIIGFCLITYAFGKTVYVDSSVGQAIPGCGTGVGSSACRFITTAFSDGGATHGDTILLTGGLYQPDNGGGAVSLSGADNITLAGVDTPIDLTKGADKHHLTMTGQTGWVIANLTIRNGARDDGGDGGCLSVSGSNLSIDTVTFLDCHTLPPGKGGALSFVGDVAKPLSISNTMANNCSSHTGGCMEIASSDGLSLIVDGLHIYNGHASIRAGCLRLGDNVNSGDVSIRDLKLSGCSTDTDTGGLGLHLASSSSITQALIEKCSSSRWGAVEVIGGIHDVRDVMIRDSETEQHGGGVYLDGSTTFNAVNLTVTGCTSQTYGGGLVISSASVSLSNSLIHRNFCYQGGGGIFVGNGGYLSLIDGTEVAYNLARGTAENGGGVAVFGTGSFDVINYDALIHDNMIFNQQAYDNMYCEGSAGNCGNYRCGTCRFGSCDLNFAETEDNGCLCHPGVSSSRTGNKICDQCVAPGMGWKKELLACVPCQEGEFSSPGPRGIEICQQCPAGTYRDAPEGEGISACTPCPPNTYFNASTAGASSPDVCVPCPSGLSSKEGSLSCDSGDASGDITNAVDAINGDLAALENSIDGRIADLESDIAGVLAAINTFTPPDAIEGGVRIGVKVYCDAEYQHNSSGDGCERIPPPELTSSTATAVSLALAGLAAVAIGLVLYQRPRGELVRSPKSSEASI